MLAAGLAGPAHGARPVPAAAPEVIGNIAPEGDSRTESHVVVIVSSRRLQQASCIQGAAGRTPRHSALGERQTTATSAIPQALQR